MAWLKAASNSALHISAVSAGEIQAGIEITRRVDVSKAVELEAWLESMLGTFNILPMDAPTFRVWAKLKSGLSSPLYDDAMIAATALVHDLTVVTRNVRHFSIFPVPMLNPFEN